MRDILIDEASTADLAQAIAYYELQREGLGAEFLSAFKSLLPQVAENPRLYPAFRRGLHKALMSRFPYLIFYRFDDDQLQIVGVMHGKRSTGSIFRRIGRKNR